MTTLREAAEALLKAVRPVEPCTHYDASREVAEWCLPNRPVATLRAALAAEDASREQLGRALCKAAGIDPDDIISDHGHVAWELVAHNALLGMLPTELRDAGWRARAEAAIAWVEAHKACDAALRNYSPDSQTYKDAVGRAEKAWAAARRLYEETCRAG